MRRDETEEAHGCRPSLAVYVIVSQATRPTDTAVLAAWRERLAGRGPETEPAAVPEPATT
ncbi:hypothetical protein ACFWVP_16910 [Streptomyces sp. NPDC058637]|uniref:hypothetical protein n=1 Tax=Streptomyces sp. NPDC058637 TaxID=3346569 RepID=UPI003656D71E